MMVPLLVCARHTNHKDRVYYCPLLRRTVPPLGSPCLQGEPAGGGENTNPTRARGMTLCSQSQGALLLV
jgi:hypothetical protein